jgi:hypothetical protein
MHSHDQIPIGIFHIFETDVTKDTSIVDEDINSSESLDGSINDLVTELDAVVIGNSFTASFLDFIDDDISSLDLLASSIRVTRKGSYSV